MFKKYLTKISIFILLFNIIPNTSKSAFSVPDPLNLILIVHTDNTDGQFNFSIRYGELAQYTQGVFTPTTQNGSASMQIPLNTFGVNDYFVNWLSDPKWNLSSLNCTANNPATNLNTSGGSVKISNSLSQTTVRCIYNFSKIDNKNPVLIIPGVMGSDILKEDEKLWLNLSRNLTDIGDEFMDPLQFDGDLNPIDISLKVGNIITNPIQGQHFYDRLIEEFQNQGYVLNSSSLSSLFLFPYDWRSGITGGNNVGLLKQKVDQILSQTKSNKVDIVAHSTGGLLFKKYTESYPNNNIGKVVFIGVPNTGSVKSLKVLLQGDSFGIPWLADSEMKKIAKNLPIIYELSPSLKYYTNKGSYLKIINQNFFSTDIKDLDFEETNSFLINDHNLNSNALNKAKNLHSLSFDNKDLRNSRIDLYTINGCKTPTLSKIVEVRSKNIFGQTNIFYEKPEESPGDGTVTLESSSNIPVDQNNKYYALEADHGKMPSQDGVRQQIVNIISSSKLSTKSSLLNKDLITQDISQCKLNGKSFSIYSPLEIELKDNYGNQIKNINGSIENNIPNSDYQIWGDHKFVFVPTDEGQQYEVKITGTGNGTFTFKDQTIENDKVTQTQVFSNIPVTSELSGTVNLNENGVTTLTIKPNSASTATVITPSSVINQDQSEDLVSPVSTSTLTGLMGENGFYRTNVDVKLSGADPIVPGQENQTSGLLKLNYKVDGGEWVATSSTFTNISITTEGLHNIQFFSTDKAGNNEPEKSIDFVIDKTAPEFIMQFDSDLKDLKVTATDTLLTVLSATSSPLHPIKPFKFLPVKVADSRSSVTATDQAGNITVITFKDKDRKISLNAEIKSLTYNNTPASINNTEVHFDWLYDKKGTLQILTKRLKSKKDFNILSIYALGKTIVTGKDQSGKIGQTFNSLKLLKVKTNKGDFDWSY